MTSNPLSSTCRQIEHRQAGALPAPWSWMRLLFLAVLAVASLSPMSLAQSFYDHPREVPGDESFRQFITDLRVHPSGGFEAIKGKQRMGERHPTWGVRPMDGCSQDWDGELNKMHVDDGLIQGRVWFRKIKKRRWSEAEWTEIEGDYNRLRSLLMEAKGDWSAEDSEPKRTSGDKTYRWRNCTLHDPKGTSDVSRIVLTLFSLRNGKSQKSGECSLYLQFEGKGELRSGDGVLYAAKRAKAEPSIDLPPISTAFDPLVRDLIKDAPQRFASFRETAEPLSDPADLKGPYRWLPKLRWPANRNLGDHANPAASEDLIAETNGAAVSEARFRVLTIEKPNYGTTLAIEKRFERLEERLLRTLPGWSRVSIPQPAGEGRALGGRLSRFYGIRSDHRPIVISILLRRWFDNERAQIVLFAETQHDRAVGVDLRALLADALAVEPALQPLTDLVATFGNPIPDAVQPGDLVASINNFPVRLEDLFGPVGAESIDLRVARDGRFLSITEARPAITLARYAEFCELCAQGKLSPMALAFAGERLDSTEIERIVRGLIDAAPGDFKVLPAAPPESFTLGRTYERLKISFPLWRSLEAPPVYLTKYLQKEVASSLPRNWWVGAGPNGITAYPSDDISALKCEVFLELVSKGDVKELQLRVEGYSEVHRIRPFSSILSNFFELLPAGDGKPDRIYSYMSGWIFEGPHLQGVPHGKGKLVLSSEQVERGVHFKKGRRDWSKETDSGKDRRLRREAAEAWKRKKRERYATATNKWTKLVKVRKPRVNSGKARSRSRPTGYYDRCPSCRGQGRVSHRTTTPHYVQSMAFSGSTAWRRGYSHVRVYSGYSTSTSVDKTCTHCGGGGRVWYSMR